MFTGKLVCFDFDETLSLRDERGRRRFYPGAIEYILFLKKQGAAVAIVTFNCGRAKEKTYPSESGKEFVREKFLRAGFNEDKLAGISIIAGFERGKNRHIEDAKRELQKTQLLPDQITLYDDDWRNIQLAQEAGYQALIVPKIGPSDQSDFWYNELVRLQEVVGGFQDIASIGYASTAMRYVGAFRVASVVFETESSHAGLSYNPCA